MSVKKITDLTELESANSTDIVPVVDVTNKETKKMQFANMIASLLPANAGSHNSIYRGNDLTKYFYGEETYNGKTFSEAVADATFDNIFVGDYIIGKSSGRKYLVGDLDYRLHTGNTETTAHHVLMFPELSMGTAQMNSTNITTGAYVGSEMYTTNLASFKTIINNDFETSHILTHKNHFQNAVTDGYESGGTWYDSTIDLMNELMVYGSNIFHNTLNGTNWVNKYEIDKSQLSIFKLDHSKIVAFNDSGSRQTWWLRSVASSTGFCYVCDLGNASASYASYSLGVRPAFLII